MTERDFQVSFERQVKTVFPEYDNEFKLTSDLIFYFLNKAKDEFVKTRYSGLNVHQDGFQLTEKRTDDLRTLVKTKNYRMDDFIKVNNAFWVDYPEDFMFTLGESTYITVIKNKCVNLITKPQGVTEATIETVDEILSNSLSEYHLNFNLAKPIRVFTGNQIKLITDGNYGIDTYEFTYLRKAKDLGSNLSKEYTELPEHTHQEIINMAVEDYVSFASKNISAITNQVNLQE